MHTELLNKISEIKSINLKTKRYENILNLCIADLKKEKSIITHLFEKLNKEKQDVEKLESLSFKSLYHSIIGDKSQQLNKEQQEYFAAKLKFDGCQSEITKLKKDIKLYEKKLITNKHLEQIAISEIINDKNLTQGDKNYLTSLNAYKQIKATKEEIQQAIKVGVVVKAELKKALKFMHSAASWGVGDMIGGGLIVTAVKQGKIKSAKKLLEKVKTSVSSFHREVREINDFDTLNFKINIGKFDIFSDYFFDGIIFDWMVQSKINESKNLLEKAVQDTKNITTRLYKELDATNLKIETLSQSILAHSEVS